MFKIVPNLQLPFQLLVASLALVANALPVQSAELKVLTPDNFKFTIAKGVWFIEHFSPYCHHCRAFAPLWQELVDENAAVPDPGIHLAQINCAVNGDLCNENNVSGYPQMNLYKDGEYVETFKGVREHALLTQYLSKHAEPNKPLPETMDTSLKLPAETTGAVTETKHTDGARHPDFNPNPNGMVISLDSSNFNSMLDDGPVFIKFFAPWCGHCKKLAPIWTQLASHMRHTLVIAEVNCEAHPALCKAQGVPGYPMLAFYTGGSGKGGRKTEYNGGRKFEQLKLFAEGAIAPAVSEINTDEYETVVKANPVLYLLLHGPSGGHALNQLTQTAHVLLGSPPIFTSISSDLRARFTFSRAVPPSAPVLLAIKDGVPYSYTSVFTFTYLHGGKQGESSGEVLVEWLMANRLSTALELGQDSFQYVMNAPHRPLVVLVAFDTQHKAVFAERMKELGKEWRAGQAAKGGRDVVFAWMDAEKWGKWMKSMYGVKVADKPTVVITDHQQLIYYDTDPHGRQITMDSTSIFPSIEGVLDGTISPKHSENFVERMARYLNDTLAGLERIVLEHPYRTAFFIIGILVAFGIAIVRFINGDISTFPQENNKKAASRLD